VKRPQFEDLKVGDKVYHVIDVAGLLDYDFVIRESQVTRIGKTVSLDGQYESRRLTEQDLWSLNVWFTAQDALTDFRSRLVAKVDSLERRQRSINEQLSNLPTSAEEVYISTVENRQEKERADRRRLEQGLKEHKQGKRDLFE